MCIIFLSKHSSDHYVLFCHDPLSHLAINVSSCMKLMHTRTDFKLHSTIETTLRNKCYCKSCNAQKDKSLRNMSLSTECAAELLSFRYPSKLNKRVIDLSILV